MKTDKHLIAEFMDYEVYPDGYCDNKQSDDDSPLPMLEYMFDNWNDLMPVVEKIESIDGWVQIDGLLGRKGCTIRFGDEKWDTITQQYSETKFEAVYKAVVQFIKWYNNVCNLNQ